MADIDLSIAFFIEMLKNDTVLNNTIKADGDP